MRIGNWYRSRSWSRASSSKNAKSAASISLLDKMESLILRSMAIASSASSVETELVKSFRMVNP